jgi:low affinity Fe/Cu permease
VREYFHRFAVATSRVLGTPGAFIAAITIIVVWALSGPLFGYNDTWQLTINTGTTIITFLMVFLIQNTQNREARATEIKLDELLRAVRKARTSLVDLEDLSEEELAKLEEEFKRVGRKARHTGNSQDSGPSESRPRGKPARR